MFVAKAQEGSVIRVGDRLMTVGPMRSPYVVEVTMDGEPPFLLGSDRKTEVLPGVFVSIGYNPNMTNTLKFLFDAPREVKIRELPDDGASRDNG
jgi:hypothetical protein